MEAGQEHLLNLLALLLGAIIAVPLAQRLRVSPVVGYLAAGVALGPYALRLVSDVDDVRAVGEYGVIFLLFTIGLDLPLRRLAAIWRYIFVLGLAQVALTSAAAGGLAVAFWLGWEAALALGGAFAFSSTAAVLQLLSERRELNTRFGRVTLGVLLFQDLAVVPLLAVLPLLGGDEETLISGLALAALKGFAALVAVLAVGRLVLRPLLRQIASQRNAEILTAANLLVALGAGWATAQFGLSMALGAFLAGLLLAETEFRHQVEADIRPFRGLLLGLFFITVGMAIDVPLAARNAAVVLGLVAALLLGKSALIAALGLAFRLGRGQAVRLGLTLAQAGEFAFVVVTLAAHRQILPPDATPIVLSAVAITIALTPFLVDLGQRVEARLAAPKPELEGLVERAADLKNHVVIAGFGRVGRMVADLLDSHGVDWVAIDSDMARVAECRARGERVYFGDASRAEVLHAAGVGQGRAAVITLDGAEAAERAVEALRRAHAGLSIVARSRDAAHARRLELAGANSVILEALEPGLQMGAAALAAEGVGADAIDRALELRRRAARASPAHGESGQD